jgi:hypothetical protein
MRYEYPISTMVNGEGFRDEFLGKEIQQAFPDQFVHLKVVRPADRVVVRTNVELEQDDEHRLRDLILNHDAVQWQVKIADLTIISMADPWTPPLDLDFAVGLKTNLHKLNTVVWQGDVLQTVYGAQVDENGIVSDVVVRWDTQVNYLEASIEVIDTITWIMRNGLDHPTTKTMRQIYGGQRWLDWLESKRDQILSYLRFWTCYSMMVNLYPLGWNQHQVMLEGAAFFHDYIATMQSYCTGYDLTFPSGVQADQRTWLDLPWVDYAGPSQLSIRQKFHEQLVYT